MRARVRYRRGRESRECDKRKGRIVKVRKSRRADSQTTIVSWRRRRRQRQRGKERRRRATGEFAVEEICYRERQRCSAACWACCVSDSPTRASGRLSSRHRRAPSATIMEVSRGVTRRPFLSFLFLASTCPTFIPLAYLNIRDAESALYTPIAYARPPTVLFGTTTSWRRGGFAGATDGSHLRPAETVMAIFVSLSCVRDKLSLSFSFFSFSLSLSRSLALCRYAFSLYFALSRDNDNDDELSVALRPPGRYAAVAWKRARKERRLLTLCLLDDFFFVPLSPTSLGNTRNRPREIGKSHGEKKKSVGGIYGTRVETAFGFVDIESPDRFYIADAWRNKRGVVNKFGAKSLTSFESSAFSSKSIRSFKPRVHSGRATKCESCYLHK